LQGAGVVGQHRGDFPDIATDADIAAVLMGQYHTTVDYLIMHELIMHII
jgi:hypothetical protein